MFRVTQIENGKPHTYDLDQLKIAGTFAHKLNGDDLGRAMPPIAM